MADVVIKYGTTQIASMSASGTKTCETAGKYCANNISVEYTQPSGLTGYTQETALGGSRDGYSYGVYTPYTNGYHTSQLIKVVYASDLGLTAVSALTQSSGTVTVAAGSWFSSAISITVTMENLGYIAKGATTYSPSTSSRTINAGYYITGTQTISAINTLSSYSSYITTSTSARTYTIKTITPPSFTSDYYIYPSSAIYNYWNSSYAIKISKPTQMSLPTSLSTSASGTQKAAFSAQSSVRYINIPAGYNPYNYYYKINASSGSSGVTAYIRFYDDNGYYIGAVQYTATMAGQRWGEYLLNVGMTIAGMSVSVESEYEEGEVWVDTSYYLYIYDADSYGWTIDNVHGWQYIAPGDYYISGFTYEE